MLIEEEFEVDVRKMDSGASLTDNQIADIAPDITAWYAARIAEFMALPDWTGHNGAPVVIHVAGNRFRILYDRTPQLSEDDTDAADTEIDVLMNPDDDYNYPIQVRLPNAYGVFETFEVVIG